MTDAASVVRGDDGVVRCAWSGADEMRRYHDAEWGVPTHDDRVHFEFLILEGAQAGLSWSTILRKRDGYRRAFAGFDPAKVARFDARRQATLMNDASIVRNRQKIAAAVRNARAFLAIQRERGSFDAYLAAFAPRGRRRAPRTMADIPATTPESVALSRDLVGRGFTFVGPTVMYAHMQAVGLVNDHVIRCFRRREIEALRRAGQ